MRGSWSVVLAMLACVAAGCAVARTETNVQGDVPPGLTCENLAQQMCFREASSAGWRTDPTIADMKLTCVGICTEANGEIAVLIRRTDGQLESMTMGWSGGGAVPGAVQEPLASWAPGVVPRCVAIAPEPCEARIVDARSMGIPEGRTVVGAVLECTKLPCDTQRGDGETVLTLDDGTTVEGSWSYIE